MCIGLTVPIPSTIVPVLGNYPAHFTNFGFEQMQIDQSIRMEYINTELVYGVNYWEYGVCVSPAITSGRTRRKRLPQEKSVQPYGDTSIQH